MMWNTLFKSFHPDLPRWKSHVVIFHGAFVILLACFAAPGYPAITWMGTFNPLAYPGWGGFLTFVKELKTGIPPLQSICELAVFSLTGSFFLVSQVLFRFALVFVYMAALYWRARSNWSFLSAMLTGTVFLWSTVLLHRLMPMTYDIFFPALGFLFLMLQPIPTGEGKSPQWVRTRCLLSGVALSLLELTRPFVLFLLPFLLVGSLSAIRPYGRKCILLHLLPLMLLSGGWHLKIYLLHEGQIVWSNHSGFNLVRAWKDVGIEIPPFIDEEGRPVSQSDSKQLNTIEHSRQNEIVKAKVKEALLRDPLLSLRHAAYRIVAFLKPGLSMYRITPNQNPILWVYGPLVWISSAWLFVNFLQLLWVMGKSLVGPHRRPGRCLQYAGGRENQLIVMTLLSMVILAMGESGEEVRLLISVLPWLAAYPMVGAVPAGRVDQSVSPSIPGKPGV